MSEPISPKIRIIDIALQAGVSTATVDRVLNNRPGVRSKTQTKVNSAMKMLNMAISRPQVIPTVTSQMKIDSIIAGGAGFANDVLAKALVEAARNQGLELRTAYPQRMNPAALVDALQNCLDRGTSGIIVQALDHPMVRTVIEDAGAKDIPIVSLLTNLPGSQILAYVGLNNRAAGRAAGLLMGRLVRQAGNVALFVGGPLYRSHEEREIGYRTILREEFEHLTLLPVLQSPDDPQQNYEMATRLLNSDNDLRGILNIGGGNRGIEKALLESGRQDQIIYGCFNLTPLTKQGLISGVIDLVIHQDMERTAKLAVGAIVQHLTLRQVEIEPLPVEIIMRENIG
jgi:LacI family transcriptional regulator